MSSTFSKLPTPEAILLTALPSMVKGGTVMNIQFSAQSTSVLGVTKQSLYYSTDGGATFPNHLADFAASDTSYNWTVPKIDNSQVVLQLQVFDKLENSSTQRSPAFQILSTAPTLTVTPVTVLTNKSSQTFSGSCQNSYPVMASLVNSDGSTSQLQSNPCSCTTVAPAVCTWSYPASASQDGVYNYQFLESDPVGNQTIVTASWTRDTVPPNLTQTNLPATVLNNLNQAIYGGACETGLSVSITMNGSPLDQTMCANSKWSYTVTATTDGTRAYTFTQEDLATNVKTIGASWTRDTVPPNLTQTLAMATSASNLPSLSLGGACENGLPVVISATGPAGAITPTSVACTTTTWSYTFSPGADGQYAITLSQTDLATNKTTVSVSWLRDTTPPVITNGSFSLDAGAATTAVNYLSVNLKAADALSNITQFCLLYTIDPNPQDAPSPTSNCWTQVNNPSQPNLPLQKTLNLANFQYRIGYTPNTYYVYAWTEDAVGNVSLPASASIIFNPGQPPVVVNVIASQNDNVTLPLAQSETVIAQGTPVVVHWNITQAKNGLGSSPVSLYYTTDDSTYLPIAQSIPNAINGSCTLLNGLASGCAVWTSTVATNSYFKIRVAVIDNNGMITTTGSNFLNSNGILNVAGNTDNGIGGSATAAIFQNERSSYLNPDPNTFVATKDGQIFFRDITKGLLWIRPTDGVVNLLMPYVPSASNTTTGAITIGTTPLKFPAKIALDYSNGLLIWDYDRIRRLDLTTLSITTLIGGGTSTADGVSPLNVKFTAQNSFNENEKNLVLVPLPNGDVIFTSDTYQSINSRIRYYSVANDAVTSITMSGTGHGPNGYSEPGAATENLLTCSTTVDGVVHPCSIESFGVAYGSNSAITTLQAQISHALVGDTYKPIANLTPSGVNAGQSLAPHPAIAGSADLSHYRVTGRNGIMYAIDKKLGTLYQFNAAGNAWIRIAGTGVPGTCNDGTAALMCQIQPTDLFVDGSNNIFFIDRGRVRTLDQNQLVVTVYGQSFFFGDNGLAMSARFNFVPSLQRINDGRLDALDSVESRIREFAPGGNITTIAGNGTLALPNTTTAANNQPYEVASAGRQQTVFSVNPVTGDILSNLGDSVAELNRSTGYWSYILKTIPDTDYCFPNVVGFDGSNLFVHSGYFDGSTNATSDGRLRLISLTGSLTEVAGVVGPTSSIICPDGTTNSTCTLPSPCNNTIAQATYDSVGARWLLLDPGQNTIRQMDPTGTIAVGTAATLAKTANSFAYVTTTTPNADPTQPPVTTETIYYCAGNGIIYAHTAAGDTALPWAISSLACTGNSLISDGNGNLYFPYTQNGLSGIGQYVLPAASH